MGFLSKIKSSLRSSAAARRGRAAVQRSVDVVYPLGPEVRHVRGRQQLDEERLNALEPRVDVLEISMSHVVPRLDDIERNLPPLLNVLATSTGSARRTERQMAELSAAVGDLWARLEVIRKELMLEVRYGGANEQPDRAAPARVVDPARLAAARESGLRVNLGCGHLPLPDYVNVDLRDLPGVDVVAPVDDLPFEDGELDELFSAHLVEHFPEEQLVRTLLPYWISKVRPGGTFRAVVPDAGAMIAAYAAGEMPYEHLREVLFGGQEYEGDFHLNMYTVESLSLILKEAGLTDITVEAEARSNGICLEMQLSGQVPT
ncbi:MAG: class I SAM-dependent methyltransferase [Actinomycetes bacterium]